MSLWRSVGAVIFVVMFVLSMGTVNVTAQSESNPVDTHALAMIKTGMDQYEVLTRLGPPVQTRFGGFSARGQNGTSGIFRSFEPNDTWIYPGNYSYPPTRIDFVGGRVTRAERLGRP